MGRRSGPKRAIAATGTYNSIAAQPLPKKNTPKFRRENLTLQCEHCAFRWRYDVLSVHCSAHRSHHKSERYLHSNWMYHKTQPIQWHKQMATTFHPRTHAFLGDENAKSMNNERRAQGLTQAFRQVAKDQRGINRKIAGVGRFSTRWQTKFPYPV
jgi:hypothetical protein